MRKVWVTTRKGIEGQYVEWYDDQNKRKSRFFGPKFKRYVTAFKNRKFLELNSEIRPLGTVIDVVWTDLVKDYLREKKDYGAAPTTIADIKHTLELFHLANQPYSTKQVKPPMIQVLIRSLRKRKLSPNTINKHLRNMKALIRWSNEKHYMTEIKIKSVQARDKMIRVLSDNEIRELLVACGDDAQWRMRILMAVCTGLRRSDIDKLTVRNIDVERKTMSIVNQKTGKVSSYQPLPNALMPLIHKFLNDEVRPKQVRFFRYKFSKKWETIKHRANLDDIEFHDLRKSFGSLQADAGVPIKALQDMYKHSSIETTMKHYITTQDSEKRKGVNTLRVKDWI